MTHSAVKGLEWKTDTYYCAPISIYHPPHTYNPFYLASYMPNKHQKQPINERKLKGHWGHYFHIPLNNESITCQLEENKMSHSPAKGRFGQRSQKGGQEIT